MNEKINLIVDVANVGGIIVGLVSTIIWALRHPVPDESDIPVRTEQRVHYFSTFSSNSPEKAAIRALYESACTCNFDSGREDHGRKIRDIALQSRSPEVKEYAIQTLSDISKKCNFDSGRRAMMRMIQEVLK
jgi:hypothetical protein